MIKQMTRQEQDMDMAASASVTLLLRRPRSLPSDLIVGTAVINHDDLVHDYAADPADVAVAREVMTRLGCLVEREDPASRQLVVSAPLATLVTAFGAKLAAVATTDPYTGESREYRAHGELTIPPRLQGIVVAVLGLDTRPRVAPLFRTLTGRPQVVYRAPELAELYRFPKEADGAGWTLAIVSIGGGYRQEDMTAYFAALGIPAPDVRSVGIQGVDNTPGPSSGTPSPADIEAVLDVQVAGALAPGARIVDYFAPNNDSGIVEAMRAAIHATPTPAAVSLSWGSTEDSHSPQFLAAMEDLFQEAAAMGVTVCAASGDSGSGNDEHDGGSHVNYPASSPHVLAVGGTTLFGDPSTGEITEETAWNAGTSRATGGGISVLFDRPEWQDEAGVPNRHGSTDSGRGVPDVAANADGTTGYEILINGKTSWVGGTSPATPLWAALICRLAQELGRPLGMPHPLLYRDLVPGSVAAGFRDVTAGDNGAYGALPGWDPTTGLGSPDGTALLNVLKSRFPLAGDGQG